MALQQQRSTTRIASGHPRLDIRLPCARTQMHSRKSHRGRNRKGT
jgi:hypothetical protein